MSEKTYWKDGEPTPSLRPAIRGHHTPPREDTMNTSVEFFRNNVEGVHGNDAEGEPCEVLMETEYSGPYHPDTGVPLGCTCGYDEFEAVMRTVIPAWFKEANDE